MHYIPRREFNECVARYNGDYRSRTLSCYDQFLVMCLAQYASKNSLMDIEGSLIATDNVCRFLTNHLGCGALTIAELYRERWNVELFFKWIKQHLHIKSFYGTSENAVYTQIWIAVCSFLILALAKKKLNLGQSLYTISQTLGFVLFAKVPIINCLTKIKNPFKLTSILTYSV